MLRIAYRLSRRIMLSAALLLIAGFATLVTVGRIYLPQIAEHQAAIVSQVQLRTGLQLSFSSLHGEWRGLLPSIVVRDLELRSDAVTVLEAEHISLSLALVRSFFSRRLVARSLSVADAHVLLARSVEGRWGLAEVSAGDGAAATGQAAVRRFVESVSLLRLSRVGVSVRSAGQTHRVLDSTNLLMRRGLFLSQIDLEVVSQGAPANRKERTLMQVRGEFEGGLFSADTVRAHLLVNDATFSELKRLSDPAVGWLPEALSGRLWYDWSRESGWQLQGVMRAEHWSLPGPGQQLAPIRSASLQVLAEGQSSGEIQGQFTDFTGSWNGASFRVTGGRFRIPGSRKQVLLSLKELDLQSVVRGLSRPIAGQRAVGDTAEFAPSGAQLPEALLSALETLRPAGELRNLHMSVPLRRESLKDFRLAAQLRDVGFSAWNAVPAVRHIDGFLSMSLDRGFIELDGSSLELAFPRIFSHDLPFQGLTGRVHWRLGDDLRVSSALLRGWGDFGLASADFSLDIPLRERESRMPLLSLRLGVEGADTALVERYTPHLLPANLRGWLTDSIRGGKIAHGGLVYHGSVRRGEAHKRSLQLFAEVRNGVLRFHPDWPELSQLDGALVLADTALSAQIRRGAMFGSKLRRFEVALQPGSDFYLLRCAGDVSGPARDLIALLDDTSLLSAGSASEWRAQGNYSARVDLQLPLLADRSPTVDVSGKLHQVDLEHTASGPEIGDISGAIDYRHGHGLRARELKAALWGQPLRAQIGPGPVAASGRRSMKLQARAAVTSASVQRWLRLPALAFADGSSEWELSIDWPAGGSGEPPRLLLRSDLQGLAVTLPPPFGKSAEQLRALEVRTEASESARNWRVRYANLATALFESGHRDLRGRVVLGAGAISRRTLPEQGVSISGQLQQLKVQDWLSTVERIQRLEHAAGREHDNAWTLTVQGLRVLELDLFGQVLRRPVLDLSMVEQRWQLGWRHPRTAGRLRLPISGEPYQFNLDRLYLPLAGASLKLLERAPADGLLAGIDPGSLPHARVHIDQLKYDQQALGQWSFTTVPGRRRLTVNDIRVRLGDASFSGTGRRHRGASLHWSLDSAGSHRTELLGALRTTDLNQLLGKFGYDAGIASESARLGLNLSWNGAPDQLALPQLSGELSLKLTDGQLSQTVGTPAEALRILGILNVNYLARRLRLDFSDLYKAGLSYDRIQGRLRLQEGRMQFDQPLVVSGPSSQLTMRGDFDLDNNEIDAELVVALPLTGDLPWMVALALPGGVPIAAGVYVAGRVFEQQLESLTSAVYHISGSLDEPEVRFKHLADAGTAEDNGAPEALTRARGRRAHGGARR